MPTAAGAAAAWKASEGMFLLYFERERNHGTSDLGVVCTIAHSPCI